MTANNNNKTILYFPGTSTIHRIFKTCPKTGKAHGRCETRTKNGCIQRVRYFNRGVPCGTWIYYFTDSKAIRCKESYASHGIVACRDYYTKEHNNYLIQSEQFNPVTSRIQRRYSFFPGSDPKRIYKSQYFNFDGLLLTSVEYSAEGSLVEKIQCTYRLRAPSSLQTYLKPHNPFSYQKDVFAGGFTDTRVQQARFQGFDPNELCLYTLNFEDGELHGVQLLPSQSCVVVYYHGWIKSLLLAAVHKLQTRYRLKRLIRIRNTPGFDAWWKSHMRAAAALR